MAHIHHVQICVQDSLKSLYMFTRKANFQLFAERRSPNLHQWAVRNGSIVFIITKQILTSEADHLRDEENTTAFQSETTDSELPGSSVLPDACFVEPLSSSRDNKSGMRDTVFNIAFEANNIGAIVTRCEGNGGQVICRPKRVDNATQGHVTIAAVRSCVGNVVHTLVDSSNYTGVFLPGFVPVNDDTTAGEDATACCVNHIDHVTFVCPMGSSSDILEWYERCFGMKRFLLTSEETESEGFIVQGQNIGLRIKAMEYWHCSESGLSLPAPEKGTDSRLLPPQAKFVIAEPIPGQGLNSIDTFLENHGGAGIQHIGLYATDIIKAVGKLRQLGLNFIDPPPAYYSAVGKLDEITRLGRSPAILKSMGILVDAEASCDEKTEDTQCNYLMQVFTKPIFERDTFFLEIIQRYGATGFGAGNISALLRAVQHYMYG